MEVFARKLKTALSLSCSEWKIIGRAYLLLIKVRLLLFSLPLPLVEKALVTKRGQVSYLSPFCNTGDKHLIEKSELLRFFKIAWRCQLKKPNCLPTSLALQSFLSSYGYPTEFRIGVQKEGDELKAHAWLENLEREEHFHLLENL